MLWIVPIEIRPLYNLKMPLYDIPSVDRVMILSLNFESNFVPFSNNSNCCCKKYVIFLLLINRKETSSSSLLNSQDHI